MVGENTVFREDKWENADGADWEEQTCGGGDGMEGAGLKSVGD